MGTFTINHHPGGHEALFEDDFPIENGDTVFHCYVSLPEGTFIVNPVHPWDFLFYQPPSGIIITSHAPLCKGSILLREQQLAGG